VSRREAAEMYKLIYSVVNERLMIVDENGYEAWPNTEELFDLLQKHQIEMVLPS
jgi:hypothetical protein